MYKTLLIILLVFSFNYSSYAFLGKCEYSGDIEKCINANKSGGSPLAIEDFVCIQEKSIERIAYQVVLDKKFTLIDEDIEKYLTGLEDEKSYFFGKNAVSTFFEAVNDISNKFGKYGYYWIKYKNICSVENTDGSFNKESIQAETLLCLGGDVSMDKSKDFFQSTDCMGLVELKLGLYENVAYNILRFNKHQVRKDEKKIFIQNERNKYDMLIEVFMVNIGYIERIWRKWPSVTPKAK